MKSKYRYYSIKKAMEAPEEDGVFTCMTNRYWVVVNGSVCQYDCASWQCNPNLEIAEQIMAVYKKKHPEHSVSVQFVRVAYLPPRFEDEQSHPIWGWFNE